MGRGNPVFSNDLSLQEQEIASPSVSTTALACGARVRPDEHGATQPAGSQHLHWHQLQV